MQTFSSERQFNLIHHFYVYLRLPFSAQAPSLAMSVDYLLHESSVGYAIFKVVHQADTVGNRLKEVQDSVQVDCPSVKLLLTL